MRAVVSASLTTAHAWEILVKGEFSIIFILKSPFWLGLVSLYSSGILALALSDFKFLIERGIKDVPIPVYLKTRDLMINVNMG